MDSVALALFRFFSRTRQKAGAAVRAPGAAPHPHPHPHECNYDLHNEPYLICRYNMYGYSTFHLSFVFVMHRFAQCGRSLRRKVTP